MRFNTSSSGTTTTNLAGGKAFSENPKLELVSILLTSFANDQFYRSANDTFSKIRELLKLVPSQFAQKAAIYARTEFGMRSITHCITAEIAHIAKGEKGLKNFFKKVFYRPDDILETFAYYINTYGKRPIPKALRKGTALALNSNWSAYQLAKYRGEGKSVKMVDILNLVRPLPKDKHTAEIFGKLLKGELKSSQTWETKLTQAGQKASSEEEKDELKGKAWKDLLTKDEKGRYSLGIFAALRNLRNISEQAPECLPAALEILTDEQAIKKSLILPFRYLTAYKELQSSSVPREVIGALSTAMTTSLQNCPVFPGKTLIALDCSASMCGKPIEIGSTFAAVLYKKLDGDLILFSNEARRLNINPEVPVLDLAERIRELAGAFGGTNFHSIFNTATVKYDRIVILSDMQAWIGGDSPANTSLAIYKKALDADPFIYSFDLQGYGTLQFPEKNIFCLAGFSDKIFEIMKILEEDREALIHKIEAVTL